MCHAVHGGCIRIEQTAQTSGGMTRTPHCQDASALNDTAGSKMRGRMPTSQEAILRPELRHIQRLAAMVSTRLGEPTAYGHGLQ
jgi:hypothetical protein